MDVVKNPVVIALFAGVVAYLYMKWKKDNDKKKNKGKKNKSTDEIKYIGLIIPAVVMVITWFIAYGYSVYGKTPAKIQVQPMMNESVMPLPNYKLIRDGPSSENVGSFSLLNKGVKIPRTLPDVFIETF